MIFFLFGAFKWVQHFQLKINGPTICSLQMICFPYMIHYVCKVAGIMSFYKCNGTTNLRSLLALYPKVGTIHQFTGPLINQ